MSNVNNISSELSKKDYLVGKLLVEKEYIPEAKDSYEFCVFCWAYFGDKVMDYLVGYCEEESNSWVCPVCVNRYKEHFGWTFRYMRKKTLADYFPLDGEDLDPPIV